MKGWIAGLAALALARSLFLGVVIPPYQVSDEPWHLDYARVVSEADLPVMGQTPLDPDIAAHVRESAAERSLPVRGLDSPPMSREAFQPPLAYALPGVAYRLAGDPQSGLAAFRTLDALAGAVAAAVAYWAGRRAFPASRFAGPVAGLTAVALPAMAVISSTANNDTVAVALAVAALGVAAGIARRGGSPLDHIGLGALVGLGALARGSGAFLLAPAAVAVLLAPRKPVAWWRTRAMPALVAAAFPILAWAGRNTELYGDPAGTGGFERFATVPGSSIGGWMLLLGRSPDHPDAEPFWPELGRTAVGDLGWVDVHLGTWAYALAAVAVLAVAGRVASWLAGRGRRPATFADRRAAVVLAVGLLAYVAGTAWYSVTVDYQPQGRYLLPAVIAGAAVAGAPLGRRGFAGAAAVLAALLGAAFYTALRTYGA